MNVWRVAGCALLFAVAASGPITAVILNTDPPPDVTIVRSAPVDYLPELKCVATLALATTAGEKQTIWESKACAGLR